jgi:hypothetical protein
VLYFFDSYDQLFSIVDTLGGWMDAGRLDDTAPGLPEIVLV